MSKTNFRIPPDEFKEIYSRVPRLCVEVVIRNDEGTLLSLRKIPPHQGEWHLPGGTVFFKETLDEAVKRVARDELGIDVEVKGFLGYMEFLDSDNYGGFDHPISLAFLCMALSGEYQPDQQSGELRFFKEIPVNTIKEQKEFLEKLKQPHLLQ